MSSTITYKGNTLTTVNNQTRVLNTRGTWLEDNITITDVTSSGGGNGIETLTILSEQSVTATTADTSGYTVNISVTESLIDGENYIVTLDGETYLCYANNKYGGDDVYMGDDNVIWGTSSRAQYPFLVATWANGVTAWGVADNSAHTVKIEKVISMQGGTPAISVVDTLDAKGGTVRTITALDISDTTATASDVAVGKYFYTANGTKTAGTNSGGGGGTPSATAHNIYFEFSDNTNTTITAYYDDSFISSAITATTPTTYGQKTVTLAQFDGVTWYPKPTETWETLIDNTIDWHPDSNNDYPYCWISDLGDVSISDGSVWRITYNNVEYRLTPVSGRLGNPKWGGGTDDGTNVPFVFENQGWGAWTGSLNVPNNVDTSSYHFKIERLVTS